MNFLIVGGGKGSWDIRGHQLGAALGARVTSHPSDTDWAWADLAVLVKRHGAQHAAAAKMAGCPAVWDALDCWRQPAENGASEAAARAAFTEQVRVMAQVSIIGATQAQADWCAGTYLPHHSRPGIEPIDASPDLRVVAYEGNPSYLGAWAGRLTAMCSARGWTFVLNPPDLRRADVIVALREGPWDGWACREWKSGVKIVNALASGRPVITQHTAAAREIGAPGSMIETPAELEAALDAWAPFEARAAAADECRALAPVYTLAAVANQYRLLLQRLSVRTPCTAA